MILANLTNIWILIAILIAVAVSIFAIVMLLRVRPVAAKLEQKYDHLLNYEGTPFAKSIMRKVILVALAIIILIIMLLRPAFGTEQSRVAQSSLDVAFVVDISLSMGVQDVQGKSRLQKAQEVMKSFVEQSSGERVTLISYTTFAATEVPLTYDLDTVTTGIDTLRLVDYTYASGSSMSAGIAEAVARLTKNSETDRQRIIILLGDGEELNGKVLQDSLDSAIGSNIPVYTVAVGSTSGGKIPYFVTRSGETYYVYDNGKDVISKMSPTLLQEIAQKTKGKFYDSNTMGGNLYTGISAISSTTQFVDGGSIKQELYPLFAVILIAILLTIHFKLYERITIKRMPKLYQISPISLASIVILPIIYVSSLAGILQGNLLYTQEKFLEAKETYNTFLQEDGQNIRLLYNSGVASYKAKLYKESIQHLSKAAELDNFEISQKASYNLGNAYYRDGQSTELSDPSLTVQQWIKAIAAYDLALQKDSNDKLAYENREFVKKKLEALQKKQDQSSNDGQSSGNEDEDTQRIEDAEKAAKDRYNRFGRYRNNDGYSRGQGGNDGPQW
jgi:Ca-activated chloride channel family protein